jgi:hypothetical protein
MKIGRRGDVALRECWCRFGMVWVWGCYCRVGMVSIWDVGGVGMLVQSPAPAKAVIGPDGWKTSPRNHFRRACVSILFEGRQCQHFF